MRTLSLAGTILGICVLSGAASAEDAARPGIGTFMVTAVSADGKIASLDAGSELWMDVRADGRWVLARKDGEKVTTVSGKWKMREHVRELRLDDDAGELVLEMNISLPGAMTFTSHGASKTFGQKLGSFAKRAANVGLSVAGAAIPGGSLLDIAIDGALSSLEAK